MPRTTSAHAEFARLGAIARLQQIDRERASILASFPELKKKGALSALSNLNVGAPVAPRRKVSAAARRAMSEGMRKFWARRKSQAKHT
jgi:hypothetical protein